MPPHRWQPPRLPHSWDSPGKNTGVGCHFLFQCMKVKSLSRVRLWRPHGLQPTRLLRPWDFPGESTGVGCHCLLCRGALTLTFQHHSHSPANPTQKLRIQQNDYTASIITRPSCLHLCISSPLLIKTPVTGLMTHPTLV